MNKAIYLTLAAVFALTVSAFAEKPTAAADNTKVAAKVTAVLAEKAPSETASKQQQEAVEKTVNYKFGQVIDLTALEGKTVIVLFPASAKNIDLVRKTVTFYIAYSNYSYKFDFSLKENNQLKAVISPLPQKEQLIPTAEARVVLGEDSLDLALRAVTIDDVNDGLGWGQVFKLGTVK